MTGTLQRWPCHQFQRRPVASSRGFVCCFGRASHGDGTCANAIISPGATRDTCGCWGGHVLPPTLSCPPATRARPWLSPSSSQQGPGTHHVLLWGFCPLGLVPITAWCLTATMPGLSPQPLSPPESSGGLRLACPHHGHSVPATGPTLSLPKPLCPHVAPVSPCHHGPPVPTAAIQAPPQPPHHSHAVPTQPRVCLSPWPLCPHKSHPLLTSATTATLCDTVTTVTLCSPQPPQPPCPHTVLVSPCHHSHSVLVTIPATVVSLSPPQPSHPHFGHHSQSVPTQPLYPAATMDTLSPP